MELPSTAASQAHPFGWDYFPTPFPALSLISSRNDPTQSPDDLGPRTCCRPAKSSGSPWSAPSRLSPRGAVSRPRTRPQARLTWGSSRPRRQSPTPRPPGCLPPSSPYPPTIPHIPSSNRYPITSPGLQGRGRAAHAHRGPALPPPASPRPALGCARSPGRAVLGRDPVAAARAGEASETRARRRQGRTCRRRTRRLERRPRGGADQRSARLQRPLPETRAPGLSL